MIKQSFILLCTIFLSDVLFGQGTTNTTTSSSYFKLESAYINDNIYNGRKDSLPFPNIITSLNYYHKNGLSIGSSVSYAADKGYFDLFTIDAGYDFNITDKLSGSLYGSKYFYNTTSNSVKGATKGVLGGMISFEPGLISSSLDIGFLFSNKTDVYITPSVYHDFSFGEENNNFSVSPNFKLTFGSLNYYAAYLNKPKKGRTQPQHVEVQNAKNINLLDYEFSIPLTYKLNKLSLFFTPAYVIPQSPLQITKPNGTIYYTEPLDNSFYFEVGASIRF
ncbi:MAG: hypothetical protein J0I09_05905 [Sphingobacteriia bacterium]|nr:hypothetical protein [Sphingobacteriia bacterium]